MLRSYTVNCARNGHHARGDRQVMGFCFLIGCYVKVKFDKIKTFKYFATNKSPQFIILYFRCTKIFNIINIIMQF